MVNEVKIPVTLSIATARALRQLSKESNCSIDDTISRAIAWHKFFSHETGKGGQILIESPNGKVKTVTLK